MPPLPADPVSGIRETGVERRLGWLYVGAGSTGLIAAFTLLVEKFALLKDPDYVPSCSINRS